MDSKRLEILLNRYWNCVSTLEEEQELKNFFSKNKEDIPDHLKEVAELFQYYESEKDTVSLDSSFDENILNKLKTRKKEGKTRRIFNNYLKVAAAVLIVATASYLFREHLEPEKRPELMGTYEDPREAYEETKKALMIISAKLNFGTKQAEKIKVFNDAEEKIKNSIDLNENDETKENDEANL